MNLQTYVDLTEDGAVEKVEKAYIVLGKVLQGLKAAPPIPQEPQPPAPTPAPPVGQEHYVQIGKAKGKPDDVVDVPVHIRSDTPITGFAFAVSYDPNALSALRVKPSPVLVSKTTVDGKPQMMWNTHINPDKGYFTCVCIFDFIPPRLLDIPMAFPELTYVADLEFDIADGTPDGVYSLTRQQAPQNLRWNSFPIEAGGSEILPDFRPGEIEVES